MSLDIRAQGNTFYFTGVLNRDTLMLYSPFSLLNDVTGTVRFDLTKLTSVDSAGLAWLIQQLKRGKEEGLDIQLCHVPRQLVSLADVSAVTAMLPIVD